LIFLANTFSECNNLTSLGAQSIFCNHNFFVDRNLFKPIANSTIKFDAIYNGQFLPFKRHELAQCVDPLAIIGYNFKNEYFNQVKSLIPNADYLNLNPDNSVKWLMQKEVNLAYNESAVGLCLSAAEGAMHASMEYLLSGLPVVTTSSIGGRDYFFDGRFVQWVPDSKEAVHHAVEGFKNAGLDREFIRSETLRKIDNGLTKFFTDIQDSLGKEIALNIENNWPNIFNDKLIVPKVFENVLDELN
jgi:glycosyltransferase involved in cell wall biosynthesis